MQVTEITKNRKTKYQKAVKVAKPAVVTMTEMAIEAHENWPILSNNPLTDPGLPISSFISEPD